MRTRAAYRDIELYEPGRLPIQIDLSDNTNLFELAPSARTVLTEVPLPAITRYPSVFAKGLKEVLAGKHGVGVENITTGCGSDDLIDSTFRAFCDPGDRIAWPSPTFGVISTFARMNAANSAPVPSGGAFDVDIDGLIAARAQVTYLCSPNNPTGNVVRADQIARLDRELEGLLLLDEAYADFGDADYATFAAASARTVSLRTLSKAHGLAGLRVGYAIGPAEWILEIEKSRGPYKVGGVAEAVASRVISDDREWVMSVIARTRENRARLAAEIQRLGLVQWPSHGNFILTQLPDGLTATGTNAALREHGVAVRPFAALPHAGECIRVTVGPWDMMEKFLAALKVVLER
jgi:histidinol-phosphate aminotransferase